MGGIDSRREADRRIEDGGFTMVRKGPTKRRRRRGDIWAQLSVSACVLLLPPLVMAAGVMVFGPSAPQGQQGTAQEAAAPQVAAADGSASAAERRFDLASADTRLVITEKRAVAEASLASEPPTVDARRAPTGQPAAAKDPTRYTSAAAVTLVRGKAREPSAMAAVAALPPTTAGADAPAAVPEDAPAATQIHSSRGRSRMGRQEPRATYRGRYQRSRSLSDMFLRPRPRG
jgi:hypothetical protein